MMQLKKKIVLFDSDTVYAGVPLALLSVTSLLDLSKYEIHIVTRREYPDYEGTLLDLCADALCLGISCITGPPIKTALRVSSLIKSRYPDLPIIWGGWQAITLPDITIRHPAVDFICTGQGERTFAEFVGALDTGDLSCLHQVPGLSFKAGGIPVHNPRRPTEDINSFPDFDVGLIKWNEHVETGPYGRRQIRINTSFGCPYRCAFCSEQFHSRRLWKGLSPERIIELLTKLRSRVDFDSVAFTDNNFFVNEKRVAEFCRLLLEKDLNIAFGNASARANELVRYSPATWQLLKAAGLKSVVIGAESANNATLRAITKDATVEQTMELCRLCGEYGVFPHLCFVLGFPLDPYFAGNPKAAFEQEIAEIYGLYKNIHAEIKGRFSVMVFIYAPYPASPLYDLAIQRGFDPPRTIEEWGEYDIAKTHVPWVLPEQANSVRLRMMKHIAMILSGEYEGYLDALPSCLRFLGGGLVSVAGWLARRRLRHDFLGLPVDMYAFQFAERTFRGVNRKTHTVSLSD